MILVDKDGYLAAFYQDHETSARIPGRG